MLVIGSKGHAIEILQIFEQKNKTEKLRFFDNVSSDIPEKLFNKFSILKNFEEAQTIFNSDNKFVLGLGIPNHRRQMAKIFQEMGGELCSVISPFAKIGNYNVNLNKGLNIMTDVIIYNNVQIGEGCLLNTACSIHHDVIIGDYCEISPGARILGRVQMGNNCSIGSNACILPKIKLGNNVTVGAGAVVIKDVPDNTVAMGVPALLKPKIDQ